MKKIKTVLNAFIGIVNESSRKSNNLRVNEGRQFYNKLIQEWLDNTDTLMYFSHNKGKSVITERFMKTLKAKIYKEPTPNNAKPYLSYSNKLVDQYNNNYHKSIVKKTY